MAKKLSDYAEIIEKEKGNKFEEVFPDAKETTKEALQDITFTIKDVAYNESTTYQGTTFATILAEVDGETVRFTTSAKAIVESLKIKEIEAELKKNGIEVTLKKVKSKTSSFSYWTIE